MTKPDSRKATKPASQDAINLRRKRKFTHSLRGNFKGKGLLKALMIEKKKEREF